MLMYRDTHNKINGNNYQTLLFTDLNATDIINIITERFIDAKVLCSVNAMHVRDNYDR